MNTRVSVTSTHSRHKAHWSYLLLYLSAGISLCNSLLVLFLKSHLTLLAGLGMSKFIDGFALFIAKGDEQASLILLLAFMLDLLLIALLMLLAWLAGRGLANAYLLALSFYGFDALLLLITRGWLDLTIHLWLLLVLYQGLKSCYQPQPDPHITLSDTAARV